MKLKIAALLLLTAGCFTEMYAQSGFRYPYVIKGTPGETCDVIVSRDEKGGVRAEYVRDTGEKHWDVTPEHGQGGADNIVASKFEVATEGATKQAYSNAAGYCNGLDEDGGGWRMPTQRELMLIYVLNDQLANPLITTAADEEEHEQTPSAEGIFYWSGTKDSTNPSVTNAYWSVCFSDRSDAGMETKGGQVQGYADNLNENYVRCVRDVTE